MTIKLRPFQREGIRRLIELDGKALLADEMGLGKTIQVLWYCKLQPKSLPAIIVCPAIGKYHWQDEAVKGVGMRSTILAGKTANTTSLQFGLSIPPLIIVNYDIVSNWLSFLQSIPFKTIILDECHYIKTLNGVQRTQAVRSIAKRMVHRIGLSGTPLTNRPSELFSILNIISPGGFDSYWDYAWTYCDRKYGRSGWDDRGAKNLDRLHRILSASIMIRRTKKQVLRDLPEKERIVVPLEIENRAEYDEAERDIILWLAKESRTRAIRARKAKELVKVGYLLRLAAKLKLPSVFRWIESVLGETDEKVTVYGVTKPILQAVDSKFKSISVKIDGSVPNQKRRELVRQFQTNSQKRIFVGQMIAAGTVITLTAARYMAMIEFSYVPGDHLQAESRLHRLTQNRKVVIYYLVAKDTIEEKLCGILQHKSQVIHDVLDGPRRDELELQIYDELINTMIRERQ